jgi:hypothetical protein
MKRLAVGSTKVLAAGQPGISNTRRGLHHLHSMQQLGCMHKQEAVRKGCRACVWMWRAVSISCSMWGQLQGRPCL